MMMSEAVTCPKCGGRTHRAREKMGWVITGDGIFKFPEAHFCVEGHWKQRIPGTDREPS